ncbi:MAG: hydroxymethylglutaryl-CoA reductase, degradative [Chloroflexi bacterium]|nr:hydroxymethylglutaryl-CoA reductase, degradative [Chloroflexota bacterium]
MPVSRLPGLHRLTLHERAERVAASAGLVPEEIDALAGGRGLSPEQADAMIENVIGVYGLPLGVATNVVVNGRDHLVPMAVEEPSVVAGLSYAARLVRAGGGFSASTDEPQMIGQIQVLDLADPAAARLRLLAAREELLALADAQDPVLTGLGGGARDVEVRLLAESPVGPMLAVHLVYDTRDAMGANAVNTALEALAPAVERISGGRVGLRILSNLADRRLARAWCRVPRAELALEGLAGDEGVGRIVEAYAFAAADPYRAATHNKGIMNGVDAVALATGNDWRALEAGAHAYASRDGRYRPLTTWERDAAGDLVGSIEFPMAAGTFGGATRSHPLARLGLRILGVEGARQLAEVLAAVGLGQNLAALRALAMEGIQRGHMKLHARQVAMAAGASGALIEAVTARLIAEGTIRVDRAEAILAELRADDEARSGGK